MWEMEFFFCCDFETSKFMEFCFVLVWNHGEFGKIMVAT